VTADSAADRLRLALDLLAAGEAMMRQNLKRLHPDDTEAQIEERLVAWLQERPGAEHGDAAGRPLSVAAALNRHSFARGRDLEADLDDLLAGAP
jgi:hypothetical protein